MNDASVSEDDVVHHVSSPGDDISDTNTPKRRKESGNSASPRQKEFARQADPGGGHCLLTRRSEPVQACHLVGTRTGDKILTKLERAWGWAQNTFNVDTRYNLAFMRANWHFLFDQRKFMLIPQSEDLQLLQRVTVEEKSAGMGHWQQVDVTTLWKDRTTFSYHILAKPQLKEPICRFAGPEPNAEHQIFLPPFSDLGPLVSHVHPHFVVVNSAQKIRADDDLFNLAKNLSGSPDRASALERIVLVQHLYRQWLGNNNAPSESCVRQVIINRSSSQPPSNGDGGPPNFFRGNERISDEQQESDSNPFKNPNPGGQQDYVESPSTDSEGETAVGGADHATSDDTTWVEDISGWAKECSKAASEGGWEPDILNDGQVVEYAKEEPLRAPPPDSWQDSVPRFKPSYVPGKFWDTEQFCSNDWVVYHGWRPLFGRGR